MTKQCVVPAHVFPRRSAQALLADAHESLTQARATPVIGQRFVYAHLAALRTAAALVAARRRKHARDTVLTSEYAGSQPTVWQLVGVLAPEFTEWAEFFMAGAGKRAACEAGVRAANQREANDLMRDAEKFLSLAEESLGMVVTA